MTNIKSELEQKPYSPPETGAQIESSAPTPEQQFEAPEQQPEMLEIQKEGFLEEAIGGLKSKLRSQKKKPTIVPQVRDALTTEVEKVMEEGLKDAFKELTPVQRQEFKIKGEQTALQIRDLLRATHVKVKKIIKLIVEWLKLLPGINRFFLEQEAKIKADKIIALKNVSDNKNL